MNPNKIELLLQKFEKERLKLNNTRSQSLPYIIGIPLLIIGVLLFLQAPFPAIVGTAFASFFIGSIVSHYLFGSNYEGLLIKVKAALVEAYMSQYHPDVQYNYTAGKRNVRQLLSNSNLMAADRHNEEDVITGEYKNSSFYFSEIHLQNEDSEGDTTTKFKGILFNIKMPGKNFPSSTIQSKPGLLKRWAGDYIHNEEYDFWYSSDDPQEFNAQLKNLWPFISHLKREQGELRIKVKGEEITIMMSSRMKLLDDPTQGITRSFLEKEYRNNIAVQLNTLLYIVEAFIDDPTQKSIEEKLELQVLEPIKLNIKHK